MSTSRDHPGKLPSIATLLSNSALLSISPPPTSSPTPSNYNNNLLNNINRAPLLRPPRSDSISSIDSLHSPYNNNNNNNNTINNYNYSPHSRSNSFFYATNNINTSTSLIINTPLTSLETLTSVAQHSFGDTPSPNDDKIIQKPITTTTSTSKRSSISSITSKNGKKKRANLPKESTTILLNWLHENIDHPYPNSKEKLNLMSKTGLTAQQLSNWFINARRRKIQLIKQ
ncbi:Tos8 protein [Pichia kluyveri]|uniref:Tos8 protein n=1 Tax=Pichia kluyveri TaxID=36015 RepID=A0AAV5R247_PICKL|nr:Tos8 protein [Pichia kluyveri]